MDEHLQAEGRSIVLRHAVNRWLEYAFVVWFIGLLALIVERWQDWNLTSVVVGFIVLGCVFAAIASIHNVRYIGNLRRHFVLSRRTRTHPAQARRQD